MSNYITRHPVKFTIRLSGLGLLLYGAWWLWNHWPGFGNWKFGGGGNIFNHGSGENPDTKSGTDTDSGNSSDSGNKKAQTDNNAGGGAKTNTPGAPGGNDDGSGIVDDVIVTPSGSYTKSPSDGKYYNDETGAVYTGNVNGIGRRRRGGMYSALNMSRTDFISKYYNPAVTAQMKSGVYPETMFAQAFIEGSDSNGVFGQSPAMVAANNLFNIEAAGWSGDTWDAPDGNSYRKYDSVADSIADYYAFLVGNSRYADALNAGSPQDQMYAIQQAGYATDPNYAAKLNTLLPYIEAAEKVIQSGGSTTTAKPTVEKADTGSDRAQDILEFYQNHGTAVKAGGGGVLLFGLVYVATDGFKKNPLRALIK